MERFKDDNSKLQAACLKIQEETQNLMTVAKQLQDLVAILTQTDVTQEENLSRGLFYGKSLFRSDEAK